MLGFRTRFFVRGCPVQCNVTAGTIPKQGKFCHKVGGNEVGLGGIWHSGRFLYSLTNGVMFTGSCFCYQKSWRQTAAIAHPHLHASGSSTTATNCNLGGRLWLNEPQPPPEGIGVLTCIFSQLLGSGQKPHTIRQQCRN